MKGVQCVEDALLAYEKGADGILISNHGGRQLDTTRPSLDVLLEIRKHAPQLLRPEYRGDTGLNPASLKNPGQVVPPHSPGNMERPFEVYVDGGIHRGTDVVKALCLGANAVGVGRGFLFAQTVAGAEGVKHAVDSGFSAPRNERLDAESISPAVRNSADIALVGRQSALGTTTQHGGSEGIDVSTGGTSVSGDRSSLYLPDGNF